MIQTTVIALSCPSELDNKTLLLEDTTFFGYRIWKKSFKTEWESSSLPDSFHIAKKIFVGYLERKVISSFTKP